jgi:hypothetical protein
MKNVLLPLTLSLIFAGCASKAKQQDNAMLEKYPQCYHANPKIVNKCIEKNDKGEKTTAMELENTQYPGQYK